jgi:putative membrane protein
MDRDELGLIRTHLANERTLLAYVRTALTFAAAGAGMIHFFPSSLLRYAGWLLASAAGLIFVVGAVRFLIVRRRTGRLSP